MAVKNQPNRTTNTGSVTVVRMLVDWPVEGKDYRCGQVVEFPNNIAKHLTENGRADSGEEAVKYALSQSEVIEHKLSNLQEKATEDE